jgi:hypothetical protein
VRRRHAPDRTVARRVDDADVAEEPGADPGEGADAAGVVERGGQRGRAFGEELVLVGRPRLLIEPLFHPLFLGRVEADAEDADELSAAVVQRRVGDPDVDDGAVLAPDAEQAFVGCAARQSGADLVPHLGVEDVGGDVGRVPPDQLLGLPAVEGFDVAVGVDHPALQVDHDDGRVDELDELALQADETQDVGRRVVHAPHLRET